MEGSAQLSVALFTPGGTIGMTGSTGGMANTSASLTVAQLFAVSTAASQAVSEGAVEWW